ncbi:hypothetical protein [Aquimarina pacifica]|uniref:hypothetical protein n=1 Tax=Aquimarina pacifica TaxID=1296415 RepID=UPI0004BA987E|nr:hypothetical protein [Aquimarina pacifica]
MSKNIYFILFFLMYSILHAQKSTSYQNTEIYEVETIKKGPFTYYQLEVQTEAGILGELFLNRKKLFKFDGSISQLSSNEAQKSIKKGTNKITLKIKSVDQDVKKGYFTGCTTRITLHGTNERIFASKETEIIRIEWNPEPSKKEQIITYVFDLDK